MFNLKSLLLFINLLIFNKESFSQLHCSRKIDVNKVMEIQDKIKSSPKTYNGNIPIIRLALHNVNYDNGTGGNSWLSIRDIVTGLSNYFQPHNICFVVVSEDNINRNQYFELSSISKRWGSRNDWEELIEENRISNAINIYFVKDMNIGGRATGHIFGDSFPTVTLSNFTEGVPTFNSQILAHEIGHCIGLFHTHEVFYGVEEIPRSGSLKNCENAGDLLCDTPADHNLNNNSSYVDGACYYVGGVELNGYAYEPDPSNIMSYSFPSCMTNFSYGQGDRMRFFILYSNVLDPYVIPPDYNLSGNIYIEKFIGVEKTITSSAKHYIGDSRYEAGTSIHLTDGFSTIENINFSFSAKIKSISCNDEFSGNNGLSTNSNEIKSINTNEYRENGEVIDFSIYPNPTNNIITIKSMNKFDEHVSINVLNINGQLVYSNFIEVAKDYGFHGSTIDLENLKQGVYFLLLSNSKFSKTYKVIKYDNQ